MSLHDRVEHPVPERSMTALPAVLGLVLAAIAALGLVNVGVRALQNYLIYDVDRYDPATRPWRYLPEAATGILLGLGLFLGVALAVRGRDAGRSMCVWLCCAAVPHLVVLLGAAPPVGYWHLRGGLGIVIVGGFAAIPAAVFAALLLSATSSHRWLAARTPDGPVRGEQAPARGDPATLPEPLARTGRWFGLGGVLAVLAAAALDALIASADPVGAGRWVLVVLASYDRTPSGEAGSRVLRTVLLVAVVLPGALLVVGGVVARRGHPGGRAVAWTGGVMAAAGLTGVVTLTVALAHHQTRAMTGGSVAVLGAGGLVALAAAAAMTMAGLAGLDHPRSTAYLDGRRR